MATAFMIEVPNMSAEQAATVITRLNLGGKPPAGQVLHIDGPMAGGGTRVVDVWETPEALQAFIQERLAPIFQDLGIDVPTEPSLTWPINNVLK